MEGKRRRAWMNTIVHAVSILVQSDTCEKFNLSPQTIIRALTCSLFMHSFNNSSCLVDNSEDIDAFACLSICVF